MIAEFADRYGLEAWQSGEVDWNEFKFFAGKLSALAARDALLFEGAISVALAPLAEGGDAQRNTQVTRWERIAFGKHTPRWYAKLQAIRGRKNKKVEADG